MCTLFFSSDLCYFPTLKLNFLTEGLRLSGVTVQCNSAHVAMVPLFTLFSASLPCHFLHWMEENQAGSPLSPPLLSLQQFPMGNVNSMNKDTN